MKLINWISEKRLLDGYIGILGVILFYKILAKYHTTIDIFSLSMRAWKTPLFGVHIEYHSWNKTKYSNSFYPPVTAKLYIWKWTLFDNSKEPARLTSESVNKYMAASKAVEVEKDRLIQAAKEAGL